MLRRIKKLIVVLSLQLVFQSGFGQSVSLTSPTIPSPNAASLGQYGDLPISYFTGVPDISVPLYEISGNKISLPISLSYHAGGLRPDIHPGWVGNGWSLNAGGTITRKMNQTLDEMQYIFDIPEVNGVPGNGQYYLRQSDWASDAKVKSNTLYNNIKDLDVEPDEFDFNFLGYSGKFFLDASGTWRVQCDKSIKVLFNLNDLVTPFINTVTGLNIKSQPQNIIKTFGIFTLIDEKGTRYIFGSLDANNSAIEYSGAMIIPTGQRGQNNFFATSWYLSQIISADGSETINLTYERGPFTTQLTYSSASYQTTSGCGTTGPPQSDGVKGNVVSPVYLKSITMPVRNLQIDFDKFRTTELNYMLEGSVFNSYVRVYKDAGYSDQAISSSVNVEFPSFYTLITSPSVIPYFLTHAVPGNFWDRFMWMQLSSMTVKNTSTNSTIEAVSFTYNDDPAKRLALKRVTIDDKKYTFYYNPLSLPNYMTIFGDHWGFNNFGNTTSNAIPAFTTLGQGWPSGSMETIREPDPTGIQTQAEILTDIFYPTGGKVHFDYEPNKYSLVVRREIGTVPINESGVAGGLRIKQITKTNNYGTTEQRNFYYVNGYSPGANPDQLPSSGVLDVKPIYHFVIDGIGNYGGSNSPITMNQYQSSSVVPLTSNSMSHHIGYSNVIEKRSDGGYTIYQFSNHEASSTSPYNDIPAINSFNAGFFHGYLISSSNYFKRGRMLQKTDYNAVGNKVYEEISTYTSILPEVTTNAVHQYGMMICPPSVGTYGLNAFAKTAYNIISTPYMPYTATRKFYSSDYSGNAVSQATTYYYDQYRNLISQTTKNSKGQDVTNNYRYPYHFSSSNNPVNPYTTMVNLNDISAVIEKWTTVGNQVVSGEIYSYKVYGVNKVYNDAVYRADLKNSIPGSLSLTASNDAGDLSMDSRYKKIGRLNYDPSGNVSSVLKTGNETASYIWDYNMQLPAAKIVNANNIYAVNPVSGPIQQTSNVIYLRNVKYITYSDNITVSAASGSTATINLSFAYSNYGIPGNNSSTISYSIHGITEPNFFRSGNLCAATYQASCSPGYSSTATITVIPSGQYRVTATLVSVTGFDNYYGYKFTTNYPISYQTLPVVANNEVAYTSFEYANTNELTYGTGNLSGISLSNIQNGSAVTGDKYYLLNPGNPLTKGSLDPAKTYVVSYWSNSPYPLTVSGSQSATQISILNFDNWKCYEHKVTNTSSISISANGTAIDELRIYPDNSQMTTYTYTPLVGMTSQCDINNRVTYYEYDAFNRLKAIRDKDRNIIKLFDYKY